MRELNLFTGAGGGVLGTKLLGWQAVGYVEQDRYCQQVLRQRIDDGIFDNAPIFSDIDTFISEGFAQQYKGMVDVISAGFPCQGYSVAGKHKGEDDDRNKWPETRQCIRIIMPEFVFLENVPNLLVFEYYGQILRELAEIGYDVRWRVLSGAEVGAPHLRDRWWAVAYTPRKRMEGHRPDEFKKSQTHADEKISLCCSSGKRTEIWETEPRVGRMADGVAHRSHRLKAAGNGQIPQVAAAAWEILTEGIEF